MGKLPWGSRLWSPCQRLTCSRCKLRAAEVPWNHCASRIWGWAKLRPLDAPRPGPRWRPGEFSLSSLRFHIPCAPCRAPGRNTQLSDGLGRRDIPHTLTNQEFKHNDCVSMPLGALSLNSPCANWRARQHHPSPCSQPRMEMSWAALPTKSRSPCKTPAASGALHDFQFSQEVKSKQQQASNSLFPTLLCLPPSAARALLPICCFGC